MGAGARLGMDKADELAFGKTIQRPGNLIGRDDLSPGRLHKVHGGPAALHDIRHASAKDPVDTDDDFIPRFDQVDRQTFHSGHASATDRKGEGILGLKNQTVCTLVSRLV